PNEQKPVLCVSYEGARAFCQARGADLPSEAQIEYAASALESRFYVWGSDEPDCDDAVLRRYGYGLFKNIVTECTPPFPPGGAELVGSPLSSPRRDRPALASRAILSLCG